MLPFVFFCSVLVAFGAGLSGRAAAQELRYDVVYRPPGARYLVLESPHFDVIFQEGLEAEAREAAAVLEEALPQAQRLVGSRRVLHMPVVLNRFNDRANGYVSPFPFRQEIEGIRVKGNALSPRFTSWLQAVAPHELAHAVQADRGSGLGFGAVLRFFAPDLARGFNLMTPDGIDEGLAVYFESQLEPGAGRLHHSLFNMQVRAAMLSARPWTLAQVLEAPAYTRPFDRYYTGGAHFFQYLAAQDGARFFRRAANLHYRFPFLGYGLGLWYGTGKPPFLLGRRFRRAMGAQAQARLDAMGTLTEPTPLGAQRGLVHRRPRWLDDETLVVYAEGYHLRPGFYRVDAATGARTLIRNQRITEDYYFSLSPDRRAILFARYVPDPLVALEALAEAFRLDVATGQVERLTRAGRVVAPVEGPGAVWALQSDGQFNRWVRVEGGQIVPLSDVERVFFISLLPAPDGRTVAALLHVRGHQGIFRVAFDRSGVPRLSPWLLFEQGAIYDASWSDDGQYLLFSADPDGVANLYALDVRRDRLFKLTNVPFGALEASLSPDGQTLAFVQYEHERYDLVRMPFAPEAAEEIDRRAAAFGTALPWTAWLEAAAEAPSDAAVGRPYRARRYLAPRMLFPVFSAGEPLDPGSDRGLGWQAGLALAGTDPLQQWAYAAESFYQAGRLWGSAAVQTGKVVLRPALEVFDRPSTVLIQQGDAQAERLETRRVGREERGAALTLALPVQLQSNVFSTRAAFQARGELQQERLFELGDGTPLRPFSNRLTLTPTVQLGYRLQANLRDLVPNTGLVFNTSALIDVWTDAEAPRRRAVLSRLHLYLPFLRARSVGLRLSAGLLVQNSGSILNLDPFMPRGQEDAFLGTGTFIRYALDYTQPLWYIDNGFLLLPLYFKVLYGYAFTETLHPLNDWAAARRSSVGGGLGLRTRFLHLFDLEFRLGFAYLPEENRGVWVFR